MSGQIYFHPHEESNKTITVSPEKTCDEVNLPVTANNITTTPTDIAEALNSSNVPNAFNTGLDKTIPSISCPSL